MFDNPFFINLPLQQVIEAWAGLGYYSRGRRLLEGSQVVMNDLDGKVPTTSADLLKHLPGVGKYTACAIASICSGEVRNYFCVYKEAKPTNIYQLTKHG